MLQRGSSMRMLGTAVVCAMLLVGCNRQRANPDAEANANRPLPASRNVDASMAGVTPMADRVAVLGLLNKRNGLVRDVTLKPGESLRIGRAVVRLRACERTAQWEWPAEVGAFVQLDVLNLSNNRWQRNFSGWLFKNRPERNIIQHPIYDVFVRSCTMSWPGERPVPSGDAAPPAARAATPAPAPAATDANAASSAPQSPDTAAPAAPAAAPQGDSSPKTAD